MVAHRTWTDRHGSIPVRPLTFGCIPLLKPSSIAVTLHTVESRPSVFLDEQLCSVRSRPLTPFPSDSLTATWATRTWVVWNRNPYIVVFLGALVASCTALDCVRPPIHPHPAELTLGSVSGLRRTLHWPGLSSRVGNPRRYRTQYTSLTDLTQRYVRPQLNAKPGAGLRPISRQCALDYGRGVRVSVDAVDDGAMRSGGA